MISVFAQLFCTCIDLMINVERVNDLESISRFSIFIIVSGYSVVCAIFVLLLFNFIQKMLILFKKKLFKVQNKGK